LYQYGKTCASGLAVPVWSGPAASHLIGELRVAKIARGPESDQLGVITQAGGFQPIKLPKQVPSGEYAYIAF
jgi:hypothetical protein